MKNLILLSAVLCFLGGLCACQTKKEAKGVLNTRPPGELYSFNVRDIDGNEVSLSQYKGKVLLIVNVASECRFTHQYKSLEELYRKYKDRGFVVLAFPANNFGEQEPGTNAQIKEFCRKKFSVTFPLFAKISVIGRDIDPLYAYLTDKERNAPFGSPIKWNFAKFIIDREGRTVAFFRPFVDPIEPKVVASIEEALNK